MKHTSKYDLNLPDGGDAVRVSDLNENFEKIDKNLGVSSFFETLPGLAAYPNQNLVFFHNPTNASKKVSVATWYRDVGDGEITFTFDVPSHQCVSTIVYNGKFGLWHKIQDTVHSESIQFIELKNSYQVYSVSGSGVISVWSERLCLTGDTLVTMADYSKKRLDEVCVDDDVLSFDWETMQLVPKKVIFTDKDEGKTHVQYDVWTFDDDTQIKTVHRHEFYNAEEQRMLYMDEWEIGDHAYTQDGEYVTLVSHETVYETVRHYKITLEGGTNYFANGLLTGDRYNPEVINL